MVYTLLEKVLLCTYLKTAEHEMILSYAKFLNLKMAKQLVKIWKQRKKTFERFFNTFSQ